MINYIARRLIIMIPTLIIISVISFVIIQLPPGDFLTSYVASLQQQGQEVNEELIQSLKKRYGLNQPLWKKYFKWIGGILHGDFGFSFAYDKPVSMLLGERIVMTILLSLGSMLFTWIVAFPIGLYSATHQYSLGDYFATFIGFLGLATPNFMIALILMYIGFTVFGTSVGGLFSPAYKDAAWSVGKFVDLLRHLWIPVIVIGTAGTAGLIRILRANLLDELQKQYVTTARAKGVSETKILLKYPVRVAINPFISTIGWMLPRLISGATITSIVLNLPTTGPLLLSSLKSQDMYLAGSFVFMLSFLTVIGTLVSDILLAWVDPRIRYD